MKTRNGIIFGVLIAAAIYAAADGVVTTQSGPLVFSPASGRVGIGTSNPAETLHVVDGGHADLALESTAATGKRWLLRSYNTGVFAIHLDGVGDKLIFDDDTGNMGVGTSPQNALTLSNTGRIGWKKWSYYPSVYADIGTNRYTLEFKSCGADYPTDVMFSFITPGGSKLAITNEGKVGVGTTSPGEKLEVSGNIKASWLAGSGNSYACVDSNGKLYRSSKACV